jgi:hypothetical protein
MRSNLKDGKLLPPKSLADAVRRRQQLVHEQQRIQAQLDDPKRQANTEWLPRARTALGLFKNEERQLAEWIDSQLLGGLFRQAYDLLKALQKEVDFEPNELELMHKLDAFFKNVVPQDPTGESK